MYEYETIRRVCYKGGATFVPVCEKCGRFVKPNPTVHVNHEEGLINEPNATCSKCGPTKMMFEGFI